MKVTRLLSLLLSTSFLAAAGPAGASEGTFERAFGGDVLAGGPPAGAEICTTVEGCQAGANGALGGEFDLSGPNPGIHVAIDASGITYVSQTALDRIDKFDASGNFLLAWGRDVDGSNAGTGFETCTVAADCKDAAASTGKGGELNQPADIAVDGAGNVYVADTLNHRVQQFTPSGGFIRAWGKNVAAGGIAGAEICGVAANCQAGTAGALGGEFDSPWGIAVDSAGGIFVSETLNERVQKFGSNAIFDWASGKDVLTGGGTIGEVCTVAANCKAGLQGNAGGEFDLPLGLGVDSAKDVYVADASQNNRVQKLAGASGAFTRTWGDNVDSTTAGTGAEVCTVAANCKAADPVFLGSETSGGEFLSPQDVAADGADDVYVTDFAERVQKFDDLGVFIAAWGFDVDSAGSGTGPEVCTVAANCRNGAEGGRGGEFRVPQGIAASGTSVVVGDLGNSRVQLLTAVGAFVRSWGRDVAGPGTTAEVCTVAASCQAGLQGARGGELNQAPGGIAYDSAGNVYVAETTLNRISKFGPSGNFLRAWGKDVDRSQRGTGFEVCTAARDCKPGSSGPLGGELAAPRGLAVDSAGDVYVAEGSRISVFDSSGAWKRSWGRDVIAGGPSVLETCTVAANCGFASSFGGSEGVMNFPSHVAVDGAGNVYVGDFANRRVQQFTSAGAFVRTWGRDVDSTGGNAFEICTANCKAGIAGTLGGEFTSPTGLAVGEGSVYVADQGRIQAFDGSGNFQRAWGRNVDSVVPTSGFEVCTVRANCQLGSTGTLGGEFVSSAGNPINLAVDPSGDVYAAEGGPSAGAGIRVQRFSSDGAFKRAWGTDVVNGGGTGFEICTAAASCKAGFIPTGLGGELGEGLLTIAAGPGGVIAVGDGDQRRVQVFAADPAPPVDPGPGPSPSPTQTPTPTPTPTPTQTPTPTPTPATPSNSFTIGKLRKTTLEVEVVSAGTVAVEDASASATKRFLSPSSASGGPGVVEVALKLNAAGKKLLKKKGKVKVSASVTFTPAGGTAAERATALTIKEKKPKKR